ncbi:MAG: hypothetical protein ACRDH2_21345, partial [Anaerolineales bacterium]
MVREEPFCGGTLASLRYIDWQSADLSGDAERGRRVRLALDVAGWGHAALVLTSLVPGYAEAERSEESNSWRHPVDLVKILDRAFEQLPEALQAGRGRRNGPERGAPRAGQSASWAGRADLIPVLLGEDAQAIADALLDALRSGATEE